MMSGCDYKFEMCHVPWDLYQSASVLCNCQVWSGC